MNQGEEISKVEAAIEEALAEFEDQIKELSNSTINELAK